MSEMFALLVMKCPDHPRAKHVNGVCDACGWKSPVTEVQHDRCKFTHNGRRCPFPATWADRVRGGGADYCDYHADYDHHGHGPDQDFWFDVICKDEYTVRDKLEEWRDDWREPLVLDTIAQHPEWQRRDDETHSEYGSRMAKLGSKLAKRFAAKSRVTP